MCFGFAQSNPNGDTNLQEQIQNLTSQVQTLSKQIEELQNGN
jgi:peptidoglycan hydrolase CwlO-like protein